MVCIGIGTARSTGAVARVSHTGVHCFGERKVLDGALEILHSGSYLIL